MSIRSLKRRADGFFTIDSKIAADRNAELCDLCANDKCAYRPENRYTDILEYRIHSCDMLVPKFAVKSDHGLVEPKYINTLRTGIAWERRLKQGDIISFVNADTSVEICRRQVYKVESGPYTAMLREHAHRNHLFFQSPLLKLDMPNVMDRKLRNLYGNLVIKHAESLTAIYTRKL